MTTDHDHQLYISGLIKSSRYFGMSPADIKAEDDALTNALINELFVDLDFSDVENNAPDQLRSDANQPKLNDALILKLEGDEQIAQAIADLENWLEEETDNEPQNVAKFEQDEKPTNSPRRKANYPAMLARKKSLKTNSENQKRRIFRTRNKIAKRLASTEAMRFAAGSAKGDLTAATVYIDLLPHLPITSLHQDKKISPPKIPKWRDLSDQATACFYQLGAAAIEADSNQVLVPFTWNLSEHLWRAADGSKENDVTYLQHLLKTTLKRALYRTPEFWFAYHVAEKGNTGKPHLHGSLLIEPSEAKRARAAFHQLNGEVTRDFKRHAIIFTSGKRKIRTATHGALHTNLYWSLYCIKERGVVRSRYLVGQKTFTATRGITQAAKSYHDQLSHGLLNITD